MKNMKVLLVDDEEEFVQALAERLKMRDLRSDTVFDGEEALSFVEDQEPDVMVLDLKMPGIDGMEVLRQVRKVYPNIQVIILTGHGTEKHEEEAKRLGAFDYLEKPVNLDVLVKKMKAAYRRKLEDTMVAATFAEAGDFESAKKSWMRMIRQGEGNEFRRRN
jgi:DNA-binding response OmpR family regulator